MRWRESPRGIPVNPEDEDQLIADIEAMQFDIKDQCRDRGRGPADAMMMMLIAASQLYREYAKEPQSRGQLHEALDKAYEAAAHWWPLDETGRLQ